LLIRLQAPGGPSGMGLILLGQRYSDPATGRFLTRDPIGYEGGINVYAYTGNNPVNGIDPTGLDDGDDYLPNRSSYSDSSIYHPAIHKVVVPLRDGADEIAKLNPIVNAGTLISGQHASGRAASGWDRAWAAVAIIPLLLRANKQFVLPLK